MTRFWARYQNKIYDLTDYFSTINLFQSDDRYQFLDSDISTLFQERSGQDITGPLNSVLATKSESTVEANMACLNNYFNIGENDFRKTARCEVQNTLLLVFTIILMVTIASKFLAALQLTPKRHPE